MASFSAAWQQGEQKEDKLRDRLFNCVNRVKELHAEGEQMKGRAQTRLQD
jgi:hypothetical protein